MKTFKVEGTLYYDAEIVLLESEEDVLRDYRESINSNATLEEIVSIIAFECAVHEETFIEGIGQLGDQFEVIDKSFYLDNPEVKVEED